MKSVFFRANRSLIINVHHIAFYFLKGKTIYLQLLEPDAPSIRVGRTRNKEVLDCLQAWDKLCVKA